MYSRVFCEILFHVPETMGDKNSGSIGNVAEALAEKQPNSIKEVVKFLADLVGRLDVFSTEVKGEIAKVASSNTKIFTELGGVRDAISFMNENFELFRTDVEAFRKEIEAMKVESALCRRENEELRRDLREARREIVELKQYSRNMNIEIQGLPQTKNEDLEKTVANIAKCLGTDVTDKDIDIAHRVLSKDKKKSNVIVRFLTRTARDKLLSAARKAKLDSSRLGFDKNDPVYINEHLCMELKVLLSKARQARREKEWKYVWVSQGRIFMRKADRTPLLHVTSDADLAKVV